MNALPAAQAVGTRFAGRLIAVSVSDTEDLAQMGMPPDQMDLALQALLVPLVAEGARIAYGGRIEHPHNFTLVISDQLGEAYRRLEQKPGQRPFVHIVAQHRFLATEPARLLGHLQALAPYGEIWVTGETGVLGTFAAAGKKQPQVAASPGPRRPDDPGMEIASDPAALTATAAYRAVQAAGSPGASFSFTTMRTQMAARCDARVQVGGRKSGFTGPISGLCEEALLTIDARRPLFVLGGFGGASRDIAAALGQIDASLCVPRASAPDEAKYAAGLSLLRQRRSAFESLFPAGCMGALRELASTESLADAAELLSGLLGTCLRPAACDDAGAGA